MSAEPCRAERRAGNTRMRELRLTLYHLAQVLNTPSQAVPPHSRKQLDVLTGGLMAAFLAGVSMPEPSPNPLHGPVLLAHGHSFVSAAKRAH